MAVESRQERRLDVCQYAVVTLMPVTRSERPVEYRAEVLDRSRRGLRFKLEGRPAVGQLGTIQFAGDGERSLSRQFEVRWVRRAFGGFEVGARLYLSRSSQKAAG